MAFQDVSQLMRRFLAVSTLILVACGGAEPPSGPQTAETTQVEQAVGTAYMSCDYADAAGYYRSRDGMIYQFGANQAVCEGFSTSWTPETPQWNYLTPSNGWSGWYPSGFLVNWANCVKSNGSASRIMYVDFRTFDGASYSNVVSRFLPCL